MRSYLVIPAGTPILRVAASTPHYAASKARRGKAEHYGGDTFVVPASSVIDGNSRPLAPLPGQLTIDDED